MPDAVILDVDGTMYAQAPVRAVMLLRLALSVVAHPRRGWRCVSALRAYRRAHEVLRYGTTAPRHAGREQLRLAAIAVGLDVGTMRAIVERWMEREPLQLMARHARPGLRAFLLTARRAGARVGVLSDYPAEAKLRALGVRELVDVVRSAHDDELGRLKPDPSGLQLVAADLGVPPSETVYVGDRPAVDAVAAARAGMRAYIIGANHSEAHVAFVPVASFAALSAELFP